MSNQPMILLDTHVWVWLVLARSDRIAPATRGVLSDAADAGRLSVSVMSVWEIGMLESKGRLRFPIDLYDWMEKAMAVPGLRVTGVDPVVALDSSGLAGDPPHDPVDRLLIATARRTGATLVTADAVLLNYARRTRAVRTMKVGR